MSSSTRHKWLVLGCWLALLVLFWGYAQSRGLGPRALVKDAVALVTQSAWGPLLLLAVYLVRPLLLLPVTLLTIASGFLFGAFWGFAYALLAMLASSALAYGLAYFLGNATPDTTSTRTARFANALRRNSFETVLVSRFLFVPGDLINYSAGLLRMNLAAFLLATAIGGAPGLLIGTLAGASASNSLPAAGLQVDASTLLWSAVLLAASLATAALLRKRRQAEAG